MDIANMLIFAKYQEEVEPELLAPDTIRYVNEDWDLVIRYMLTDIVVKNISKKTTIDSGGDRSEEMRKRINEYIKPFTILEKEGKWFLKVGRLVHVFKDKMSVFSSYKVCYKQTERKYAETTREWAARLQHGREIKKPLVLSELEAIRAKEALALSKKKKAVLKNARMKEAEARKLNAEDKKRVTALYNREPEHRTPKRVFQSLEDYRKHKDDPEVEK